MRAPPAEQRSDWQNCSTYSGAGSARPALQPGQVAFMPCFSSGMNAEHCLQLASCNEQRPCSGWLSTPSNANVVVSSTWLHCSAHQSCMLYWRHGAAAAWQGPTAWAPCGGPQGLRRGWPAPSLVHRLAVHSKGAASQPERQQTWWIRRWPAERLAVSLHRLAASQLD